MTQDLFTPVKLGRTELKNRVVMAPLTRNRAAVVLLANLDNVPRLRDLAQQLLSIAPRPLPATSR